jgi:hypothetical protein
MFKNWCVLLEFAVAFINYIIEIALIGSIAIY